MARQDPSRDELLEKLAGRRVIASVSGGKDSAALSLWPTAKDSTLGGSVNIVKGSPASNSTLANSDYNISHFNLS